MKKTGLLLLAGVLALMTSCGIISNQTEEMTKQLNSIKDIEKLQKPTHDTSMYPDAEEGQERFVIHLPKLEDENKYEVELTIGKWAEVDCNHHSLIGEIQEETVDGWGYNYYNFESDGDMISTRMGCPDQELESKLINAQSIKVRYNSKLPIVVYVPEGYTVSYSLWTNIGSTTLSSK